ncbi:PepSY domain-containing protein [Uliginosibacterium paludis]|uniref:Peptidase n=1 Tax=Uliginosibacterium paludis TaxID=1615952 RepID=A0ABV2CU45_9RHOO
MCLRSFCRLLSCGLLLLSAAAALAGEPDRDQDSARAALQSGQAMSYARLQAHLSAHMDCRILEARLHPEKDTGQMRMIYEIKAIRSDGQILKLELDAASGEILKLKNKGYKD